MVPALCVSVLGLEVSDVIEIFRTILTVTMKRQNKHKHKYGKVRPLYICNYSELHTFPQKHYIFLKTV